MLEQLSKKDAKWRNIAYSFCYDKQMADDIVQDMYIKSLRYDKPLNDSYIYMMLKSIFLMHVAEKNKKISLDDLHFLKDNASTFEINDEELEILLRYDDLDWKQKELIELSYDKSLRQIEQEFPLINYGYAHRQITNGIKKILGDKYDKKYNNSNLKYLINGRTKGQKD